MPQICDGQPSVYIVGWPHCASRGPTTVLSNTHHQHPLARLRSSTGQQPQTNRRSNHPGSSTFFQRQSPQLFTTSLIRRLTPLPPSASPLSRLYTRLPVRALALTADSLKALGATNINSSNEEQPLSLAARTVVGVELEDGRLWSTHPPKNRPWLDFN